MFVFLKYVLWFLYCASKIHSSPYRLHNSYIAIRECVWFLKIAKWTLNHVIYLHFLKENFFPYWWPCDFCFSWCYYGLWDSLYMSHYLMLIRVCFFGIVGYFSSHAYLNYFKSKINKFFSLIYRCLRMNKNYLSHLWNKFNIF